MVDQQPYDSSDPEQVEKAQEAAKLREAEMDKAVALLLDQPFGRAWLWRELEMAGIFRSTFSSDAMQLAFLEGQRNRGLWLLAQVTRINPEAYVLMMREAAA